MVLINVMTPAELVPLANGLAQSCISLARFIGKRCFRSLTGFRSADECRLAGPLLGGSVFAASIADPQNANPAFGFRLIAVSPSSGPALEETGVSFADSATSTQGLCFVGFLLSWRIK